MDILQMIDRLEELLNESRPLPFTHNVIVDEDQQLLAQRDRLIAQAQEEANRTVNLARDRSNELVERDQVVQAAYSQAEQIKAQAQMDGVSIRREADGYVLETLRNLEMEMERAINQVRNGIRTLQEEEPKEEEQK
jgi:hypothetical protein